MSHPKQRLDTADDATAYRVASLLRRQPHASTYNTDTNSLRSMTAQIEEFLSMAPQVPPVRMEPEWATAGENEEGLAMVQRADGQPVIQLNVVAGVLEETQSASLNGGGMSSLNGVLLPTAENQQELHRREVEQAQAMLNLMSALAPTREDGVSPCVEQRKGVSPPNPAAQVDSHLPTRALPRATFLSSNDDDDDDDDEVAVMDADDLNDEDTSDDEVSAQRRRIQEMN
jgi:hypothetical protein